MEVIRIKKILARNWPIGICLHCIRTLLWFVPTMSTLIYIALLASILQVLKLVKMWKYWQKISLIQSTEGQLSWIFLPSTEIPLIRWCRDMGQNQLKYLTLFLDPNVSKCIQNQNFSFFSFFLLIQYEWFHSYLPIYGQTDPKTTIVAEPAALMVVKPPARSLGGLSLARRPLLLQSYNFGPNNYQNPKFFYGQKIPKRL